MDNKDYGKMILIMGIALLLTGIGVGMYIGMFSISTYANTIPVNTIPTWFGILIALVFAILGAVLVVLGARELGSCWFDSDATKSEALDPVTKYSTFRLSLSTIAYLFTTNIVTINILI